MGQKSPESQRLWHLAGRYGAVGLELFLSVLIPVLLGHWLEVKYDFAPWGSFFGVIVGVGAVWRLLCRVIAAFKKDSL